jgi:hypothetical protein
LEEQSGENAVASAVDHYDKRIHVALPIRVTYFDAGCKPRLEMACTYDISSRGARVAGLRSVKQTGEIVAVERGKNKSFCRVVWIGEEDSELRGQVGLQSVDNSKMMWEAEIRGMQEVFDPMVRETALTRVGESASSAPDSNRRRHPRYECQGAAELVRRDSHLEAVLKNMSEVGCLVRASKPLTLGTDLTLVLNIEKYDLTFKGQVRHAGKDAGLGIEFLEIRKGDRALLQYVLRKMAGQDKEEQKKAQAAASTR